MKNIKKTLIIIIIALLLTTLPYAIILASVKYKTLVDFAGMLLYSLPIYLPVVFACFGVKFFKSAGKMFLPTLSFNILAVLIIYSITRIIFRLTERSLADAVIALLLIGPLVYSVPISFIAAVIAVAISKYKVKKSDIQKAEDIAIEK